jgi:hypothetical protein
VLGFKDASRMPSPSIPSDEVNNLSYYMYIGMFVFKQIVGNKRLARHNNIHAAYSLGKHAYLGTLKCFLSQHIATFVLKHLAAEPISRAHDRHLRLGTMGATSKRGGTRTQQCMLCVNGQSPLVGHQAALRKMLTSHFEFLTPH